MSFPSSTKDALLLVNSLLVSLPVGVAVISGAESEVTGKEGNGVHVLPPTRGLRSQVFRSRNPAKIQCNLTAKCDAAKPHSALGTRVHFHQQVEIKTFPLMPVSASGSGMERDPLKLHLMLLVRHTFILR